MAEKNEQNQQHQRGFAASDEDVQRDMSRSNTGSNADTDMGRADDRNKKQGGQQR